ncbi:MAG: tetratricopeptide repeat protein, partial [Candidatus Binataceae bacterium]
GKTPYPYDLAMPTTPDQARAVLLAHPAASPAHLRVIDGLGERLSPAEKVDQLHAAALLDPTNPYIRDRYAQSLVWDRQAGHAMAEVTHSLSASPALGTHFYLEQRLIPRLSSTERQAVEAGLKLAVARGVEGAATELGAFYGELERYSDEAALLDRQAVVERDPGSRMTLLLGAGVAYAHAGEFGPAETALRRAAALSPSDPRPYQYLAVEVYARRKDMGAAEAAVRDGIANGADAFTLYLSLADGAQAAGDAEAAESAMLKALTIRPHDYGAARRIADLYASDNQLDRAILWLRKATTIQPDWPDAYYHLAIAEEAAFQYSDAGRDFRRALELAPDNPEIMSGYQAFRKKLAASEAAAAQEQGN